MISLNYKYLRVALVSAALASGSAAAAAPLACDQYAERPIADSGADSQTAADTIEAGTVGALTSYDTNYCEYFDPNVSGTLDITDMDGVFNVAQADWELLYKQEEDDPDTPADESAANPVITSVFSQSGGSYDVSSLFPEYDGIAIGFKDGNTTDVETSNVVVYGFTSATSGTFTSMFFNADGTVKGGTGGAISNITVWGVKDLENCPPGSFGCPPPSKVPVPAGLPLMLTAMGIGVYMRKRARKSA